MTTDNCAGCGLKQDIRKMQNLGDGYYCHRCAPYKQINTRTTSE